MKGIVIATLIGCALSLRWDDEVRTKELEGHDLKPLFKEWSTYFQKQYPDLDEESHRYGIWLDNLYKIAESNDQELSYKLKINQFGDLTSDEFRHYVGGESGSCLTTPNRDRKYDAYEPNLEANPSSVDWTTKGVVTPVKNQGSCGSCWSFSATGAMECDYAIKHGTLTSLSEQQLVDCSGSYGNQGCNGGWYYNAWKYAYAEGGLCTESAYPYKGVQGSCQQSSCGTKYNRMLSTVDTRITADSDSALETAVAGGCVSVAIEADQFAFQYYSSGILTGTCGTNIDHAVLAVGYGTSGSQQYWKVKNSWGTSWGEKGYVLICRNCGANGSKGECGINMYPYVPNY